jgi:hypothetical protein
MLTLDELQQKVPVLRGVKKVAVRRNYLIGDAPPDPKEIKSLKRKNQRLKDDVKETASAYEKNRWQETLIDPVKHEQSIKRQRARYEANKDDPDFKAKLKSYRDPTKDAERWQKWIADNRELVRKQQREAYQRRQAKKEAERAALIAQGLPLLDKNGKPYSVVKRARCSEPLCRKFLSKQEVNNSDRLSPKCQRCQPTLALAA